MIVVAASRGQAQDLVPPTVPTGLIAVVASCGQVDLTWVASTDEAGGSGLASYVIESSNTAIEIAANRTTFSDANYVPSGSTLNYRMRAKDVAGNLSAYSTTVSVTTPNCPRSLNERIIDSTIPAGYEFFKANARDPLGDRIPNFGFRKAVLYSRLNTNLRRDTYVEITDEDTGATSKFLLRLALAGSNELEQDYVLTSPTTLVTLNGNGGLGGLVRLREYRLEGAPIPTSATLVSTTIYGGDSSCAKTLNRLNSGGLVAVWSEEANGLQPNGINSQCQDTTLLPGPKFAIIYRSPQGSWSNPLWIADQSGLGNFLKLRMSVAQHPVDSSIWVFWKMDSAWQLGAARLSEVSGQLRLDWQKDDFIHGPTCAYPTSPCYNDGTNGPEGEYPYLSAVPDPTRGAILLAYQSNVSQIRLVDQLQSFLKDARITIAQISASGAKTFIPTPYYTERVSQFAFSVLPSGTLWLGFRPIRSNSWTMNEIHAGSYAGGVWSAPHLVGWNFNTYMTHGGPAYPLVHRATVPEVAFVTPDLKVHSALMTDPEPNILSNPSPTPSPTPTPTPPPAPDTSAPVVSITSPNSGAQLIRGSKVNISASASDNVAVARVEISVNGVLLCTDSVAPYSCTWTVPKKRAATYSISARAIDAAGNSGTSSIAVYAK